MLRCFVLREVVSDLDLLLHLLVFFFVLRALLLTKEIQHHVCALVGVVHRIDRPVLADRGPLVRLAVPLRERNAIDDGNVELHAALDTLDLVSEEADLCGVPLEL